MKVNDIIMKYLLNSIYFQTHKQTKGWIYIIYNIHAYMVSNSQSIYFCYTSNSLWILISTIFWLWQKNLPIPNFIFQKENALRQLVYLYLLEPYQFSSFVYIFILLNLQKSLSLCITDSPPIECIPNYTFYLHFIK